MNIAIDIRPLMDPIRTGVGEYTYEFLNVLFALDKENKYYLFYNSWSDVSQNIPNWDQENVEVVRLKYPNKLFNFTLQFFKFPKIDRLINQKLDYFFSPNINFLAVSKNIKHIITIHDLSFEYFSDCFNFKRRLWHKIIKPKNLCKNAHIILTPSQNTKSDIVQTYKIDKNKIKVIYPGLSSVFLKDSKMSEEKVKEKYSLPDKFVLFFGTIEPRKNLFGLIKAFEKSGLQNKNYELVIAGSDGWKNNEVKKLMASTPNVRYIGYVDSMDKPVLYQLATVFAYPSLYEGFGFPVLEAMSVGTPVVTSNRSSLTELVGDGAYLVNPNNVSEIAEGLSKVCSNKELSDYLVLKGRERAEQFKWENTAKNFLELIAINK